MAESGFEFFPLVPRDVWCVLLRLLKPVDIICFGLTCKLCRFLIGMEVFRWNEEFLTFSMFGTNSRIYVCTYMVDTLKKRR